MDSRSLIVTHRCKKQGLNLYRVKDFLNEDIDGHFYEEEMQAVTKDIQSVYKIEQVLKTPKRQGVKDLFVKWLGWPKKFNSWIKDVHMSSLWTNRQWQNVSSESNH